MHWSMVQRSQSLHWQKAAVRQEQYTFIFPLILPLSAAAWSSLQHCRPAHKTPPLAASWLAVTYHHQSNHRGLCCLLPKSSHSLTFRKGKLEHFYIGIPLCHGILICTSTERFTWHSNMVLHTSDVILGLGWEVLPFSCTGCVSLPSRHCFILYFHLL